MKQKMYQQFVYKIDSSRILESKNKNLIITPSEARLNDEIISLADSNVLRSIDELNGVDRVATAAQIAEIRSEINTLQQSTDNGAAARARIKKLYAELDKIQLKTDFLEVVMSREQLKAKRLDFEKINAGFSVNGIKYKRLVGTSSGVKNSTVIYCPIVNDKGVHIYDELSKRLNGGRDESKPLVPAKFEAYKTLACSASIPVSMPKNVLVVDDFVLSFEDKYIELKDAETDDGEPIMTEKRGKVELNASDGFGLICPALAERWSSELNLNYTASGMCIRNLFCKGMVYTFDFHEFARRYYNSDTITDVWGDSHLIEDIEIILPVSVMKLWDSYKSLSHYLECCNEYHHGFAVTTVCEKELDNEVKLNYQFIQSYDLTDDEIKELVQPSIDEIKDTICGDADKSLLFLRGACGKGYNFDRDSTDPLTKALMIEPRLARDPFVISELKSRMSKRINQLSIGRVTVHGNYGKISGDPFAFCQSIFGCDVPDSEKGLLKAGEIYSRYWVEEHSHNKVACFRAPMSCHNSILVMNAVRDIEIDYWYRYMPTVNIINCHDMFYAALNGADNDGDAIFTTDNSILLRNTRKLPTIVCVQKRAEKCVITEESLADSNVLGFGNAIGAITNRVTAMYDVLTQFDKGSKEYKALEYRIMCGQLYQQGEIDKIKGILTKPMPERWYRYNKPNDDDSENTTARKAFNNAIVADKKPYFFRNIYPEIGREYSALTKSANSIARQHYRMSFAELMQKTDRTDEQETLVQSYLIKTPVTDGSCVLNRLCHYVEDVFTDFSKNSRKPEKDFPFVEILASKNYKGNTSDASLTSRIKSIYEDYNLICQGRIISPTDDKQTVSTTRTTKNKRKTIKRMSSETANSLDNLRAEFRRQCEQVCVNAEQLCDIILKVCYKNNRSKRLLWEVCGDQLIKNLLEKNKSYSYFVRDDNGDITYGGKAYSKITEIYNSEKEG